MLVLPLAVVLGLAIGYFATQNTAPVTIRIADYAWEGIPLYMVAVGSLLFGLLIAWIFYFARTVSSMVTIYEKDYAARRARRTADALERELHELEAEYGRLKANQAPPVAPEPDEKRLRPQFSR